MDIEIPIGKRKLSYRLFEILPAACSYGIVLLLIILSLISPTLGSIYLLIVVIAALVKALAAAHRMVGGHIALERTKKVSWYRRLQHLENPKESYEKLRDKPSHSYLHGQHLENLRLMAAAEEGYFPKPSQIYNAVIIATYNEGIEVLAPTIDTVVDTDYPNDHIILILAYEGRGGAKTAAIAKELTKRYKGVFFDFFAVKHPDGLPNEVRGKGGNITYAAKELQKYLDKKGMKYSDVIVTTQDSDNREARNYFSYLTYEYICHENRRHLAFQPVALFTQNIWDVPAPMRVIAMGNSFWNIISTMRPHSLRNFAAHSQPMDALVDMNFWSTRTIVEDGHQYWRSYFFFNGNYTVVPLHTAIYQDAVMSFSFIKTLKAQFVQVRRWDYGASDVPYVATRIFTKKRTVPLFHSLTRLWRLIDSHVTLAYMPILVTLGGWAPLLINSGSARSPIANQLPNVVSVVQTVAMIGIFVTVVLSLKILPKRPERYKKHKFIGMLVQWVLIPITSIAYSSVAAYYSQTRLALGLYMENFDVTDKATFETAKHKK
ncbi:hypothetical protein FWF48_01835 [Candidatus Saccharibacteria bacterium]|nr:hypothetical protein [Candidatus Saccharibacteria bacterium]